MPIDLREEMSDYENKEAETVARGMAARPEPGNLSREEDALRSAAGLMLAEGFAHDINNVVGSILGNAELIRYEIDDDHPAAARLEDIQQAAERVSHLTHRIVAVARGSRQKTEPVNLNHIVYHVLLSEEQRLAPRIRIIRYINPDLWKVAASHTQIAQLTLALAMNAIEAVKEKGKVYIGTRNVDFNKEPLPLGADLKVGRYILLSVEDNGEGMSPSVRARIFDPGFTTKTGRRGMGLANVYHIVTGYGGYISVNSIQSHGTAVRVYLPAFEEVIEEFPYVSEDLPKGTETILIVDDERVVLEVTQEILERLGYRTLVAHNGMEALDVARRHDGPIHLALLDLVMPEMGGREAYPLLREIRPDTRIVICTGLDPDIIAQTPIEEDSEGFLLKPFRPSVLAQEIRRALEDPLRAPKAALATAPRA